MRVRLPILVAILLLTSSGPGTRAIEGLAPGQRVWLHAHNCYPEKGQWEDRIDRALKTGARWLAIEQDIAWAVDPATGQGRSVVSHEAKPSGAEPTLEAHFFDKVRPLMEKALAENRRDTWPLMVLHLDFKTNEPAHHRAVWELLGRHQAWLTTAERAADEGTVTPFTPGPLLVLTENGEGQAEVFHAQVPVGGRLRLFGTVPPTTFPEARTSEERAAAAFAATPATLLPSGATNYRRWANFSWAVVEKGGQAQAGEWTRADDMRLRAIVSRAHELGLWVRFYTLNGHAPGTGAGWTESYNFGSQKAAELRLSAAIKAGVEFIATDQYEVLSRLLAGGRPKREAKAGSWQLAAGSYLLLNKSSTNVLTRRFISLPIARFVAAWMSGTPLGLGRVPAIVAGTTTRPSSCAYRRRSVPA
jgi:hypothetical protein